MFGSVGRHAQSLQLELDRRDVMPFLQAVVDATRSVVVEVLGVRVLGILVRGNAEETVCCGATACSGFFVRDIGVEC